MTPPTVLPTVSVAPEATLPAVSVARCMIFVDYSFGKVILVVCR